MPQRSANTRTDGKVVVCVCQKCVKSCKKHQWCMQRCAMPLACLTGVKNPRRDLCELAGGDTEAYICPGIKLP